MAEKRETDEAAKELRKRRRSVAIGCAWAVGLLLALMVLLTLAVPWSPVCNEEQYIDLNSGRQRVVKHLFFVTYSDQVQEHILARLYKKYYGEYPEPCWARANAYNLFFSRGHSHTKYGEISQFDPATEYFLQMNECTEDYEKLLLVYTLWGSKASKRAYSPLIDIYYYYDDSPPEYPLDADDFPPDSYLLESGELAILKNPLTPRAYGLDRFPELMQQIPPPY